MEVNLAVATCSVSTMALACNGWIRANNHHSSNLGNAIRCFGTQFGVELIQRRYEVSPRCLPLQGDDRTTTVAACEVG